MKKIIPILLIAVFLITGCGKYGEADVLKDLEKKVDKHNSLIERTYKLEERNSVIEQEIKVANHRIDDLERKES